MSLAKLSKLMLRRCVAFTSVTSGNSRIWPALVGVTLASNTVLSIPSLDSSCRKDFRSKQTPSSKTTHKFLFRCSKESLADISWVTGGIIIVTGLFVAAFGVFPRNQVS